MSEQPSKEITQPAGLRTGDPDWRQWIEAELEQALTEGYRRVHFRDHNEIVRLRNTWTASRWDVPEADRIPRATPTRKGRPHRNPRKVKAS